MHGQTQIQFTCCLHVAGVSLSHTVSLHNMYRLGHTAVGTVSVYCAVRAEHFDIIQKDFTRRFNTISARSPRKHNTRSVQLQPASQPARQTDRQLPPHMPARQQCLLPVVYCTRHQMAQSVGLQAQVQQHDN
jgi:hypothetical protein